MEAMIVIAIIGIMTAATIVSMVESKKNKQLETDVRKIVAVVREAQNYALSGKQPHPSPVKKACGFGVIHGGSLGTEKKYAIFYNFIDNSDDCADAPKGDTGNPAKTRMLSTFDLGGADRFGGVSDNHVYFEIPRAVPYVDGESVSIGKFQITNDGVEFFNICISESGMITESGTTACF